MTKEHRLAIQMWEGILHSLPEWHKHRNTMPVKAHVYNYKILFEERYHLVWDHAHCWLCTYIHYIRHPDRSCLRNCPLIHCSKANSPYHVVIAQKSSLRARKRACKQIIKVLKKGARPKSKHKVTKITVGFEV